jgi:hypothetical protein
MTRPLVNEEGSPFFADLTTLHTLQERYPFTEAELEILVRCHELAEEQSFLVKLATASPYSVFFLPDYTAVDRVTWLEEHVLPAGFSHQLQSALVEQDAAPTSSLEQFLEGIANTGRNGPQESLRVLYRCVEGSIDPEAAVADLVVRLALATQLWHRPEVPETDVYVQEFQEYYHPTIHRITDHLRNFTNQKHEQRKETKSSHITSLTERIFLEWAEETFPLLYLTLTNLVESLLFHGLHANVEEETLTMRAKIALPELNLPSEIFTPSIVMPLPWMDPSLSGKVSFFLFLCRSFSTSCFPYHLPPFTLVLPIVFVLSRWAVVQSFGIRYIGLRRSDLCHDSHHCECCLGCLYQRTLACLSRYIRSYE